MRVLGAVSLGGAGHLGPMRPVLDAARDRGDDVRVIGPPAMHEQVEAFGHAFIAGGEPDESEVAPIRDRLPVVSAEEASVLGNRELFGRLAARAMLPAVEGTVATWQPDLIVRDPCEYASAVVAHRGGHRVAQVGISLAEVEWGSIAIASEALEEHEVGTTDAVRATPYLTRFPAVLDPSPFATTTRWREEAPAPQPLPRWWGADDRPLVYVTLGSVFGFMTDAIDAFRVLVDAVRGLDARVLLTVGNAIDPLELSDVPPNVHVERWVDQHDVFVDAALVVCHGGSGTAFGALSAALPMVVVPLFADQFVNARHVEQAGAGVAVLTDNGAEGRRPLTPADAPRIREAIDAVRGAAGFRDAAEAIAVEMSAAPTVAEALDRLT